MSDYYDRVEDGRMIHDPAGVRNVQAPAPKKGLTGFGVRVALALALLVPLGAGLVFGVMNREPKLTPDQKVQLLTDDVASSVLILASGRDVNNTAVKGIQAMVKKWEADTECRFLGGNVATGQSEQEAAAAAEQGITMIRVQASLNPAAPKELGAAYTVVPIPKRDQDLFKATHLAVIAFGDCSPVEQAPTGPFGGTR